LRWTKRRRISKLPTFNRASEAADVARLIIEAAKKDPKQAATLLEKSKELMGDDDRTPTTTPVMDDRKMARETSGTTTFVTVQNVTGLGDFQKQYDSFTGALRHTMAGADDQSQRERMERFLNQINLLEGVSVTPEEHSRFLRLINRAAVLYGIQRHGSCWYYVEPMIT
jgi:hypothetical protein